MIKKLIWLTDLSLILQAREHRKFAVAEGDHLTMLNVYEAFIKVCWELVCWTYYTTGSSCAWFRLIPLSCSTRRAPSGARSTSSTIRVYSGPWLCESSSAASWTSLRCHGLPARVCLYTLNLSINIWMLLVFFSFKSCKTFFLFQLIIKHNSALALPLHHFRWKTSETFTFLLRWPCCDLKVHRAGVFR